MRSSSISLAALAAVALAPASFAQNDECTGAIVLTSGVGVAFDTTIGTLSAPSWPCAASSAPDLWYRYTSANGGLLTVDTCGSGYDCALQAFSGTCAALNSVVCLDDSCGLQVSITFPTVQGTTYFIRVGGFSTASGQGTITATEVVPNLSIVDNIPGTWMDIAATGTPLSLADDAVASINTTVGNSLFGAGSVAIGSNGAVRFAGSSTALAFTNAPIPSTAAFGGEQTLMPFWDDVNTVNGTIGEIYWQEMAGKLIVQWDDVGFFNTANTERATFQLQVNSSGMPLAQFLYQDVSGARAGNGNSATIGYQGAGTGGFTDFQWSYNTASVNDNDVLTIVAGAGGGGVGTPYCGPAPVNSTGSSAIIRGSGSASIGANNLVITASMLPQGAFGYFLGSQTQGFTPNPGGSQGNLCLGGAIGRFVGPGQIQNSGSQGEISIPVNLNALPTPGGLVQGVAGQTWNFQGWYRDLNPGVTSNLTDALSVLLAN